jgi:plastocyanin
MTKTRFFAGAAILVFAVACSSSDNGGAVQTPPATTSASASPCATPAAAATGTPVAVSATGDLKFEPPSVSVKVGGTVQWTVTGSASHTVTSQAGQTCSFDSGNLDTGAKYALTFTTAGTFKYFCKIHGQSMSGTVTVTQ